MWYWGLIEPPQGVATDHPMAKARSLTQFQQTFPDEGRCAAFLRDILGRLIKLPSS
jgi:hypothetical protein